jgi:folate-dependent phosphoribosylglycinamide formyltransferase PurN
MTKLRAAVLCSGDSSALQYFLAQSDDLPITLVYGIHNHPLDLSPFSSKKISTECIEYNSNRYASVEEYEEYIFQALIDYSIDIVIVINWDKPFSTEVIFNHFKNRVLFLVSPLNKFQFQGDLTAQKSFNYRHVCTTLLIHIGRRNSTSCVVGLEMQIPIYVDTDNMDILTKRIQTNEQIAIQAGISAAFENYWK